MTTWLNTPIQMQFRVVAGALSGIERYALPDAVREDYLRSYEGDRMAESMRYVRAYPAELPILRDLLPQIQTPVQIIAGRRDPAVPSPSSSTTGCPAASLTSSTPGTSPGRTQRMSTRRWSPPGGPAATRLPPPQLTADRNHEKSWEAERAVVHAPAPPHRGPGEIAVAGLVWSYRLRLLAQPQTAVNRPGP